MDALANFAFSTVSVAPSPADSGTDITLVDASQFPDPGVDGEYNVTVWPANKRATVSNAEIVRVTAKSGDTLTVEREQEDTSARAIVVGDQIEQTVTKGLIEQLSAAPVRPGASYIHVQAWDTEGPDNAPSAEGTGNVNFFPKLRVQDDTFDVGGVGVHGDDLELDEDDEWYVNVLTSGVYALTVQAALFLQTGDPMDSAILRAYVTRAMADTAITEAIDYGPGIQVTVTSHRAILALEAGDTVWLQAAAEFTGTQTLSCGAATLMTIVRLV